MSLKPQAFCPVPQETVRVARAAYPKGNLYIQMREVLGSIYTDEDFADLFPEEGQPAQAPWRLARDRAAISGEPNSSASGGRRARKDRLEISARSGSDRPRLRRLGAVGISLPPDRKPC